jgi:hypothetical protein
MTPEEKKKIKENFEKQVNDIISNPKNLPKDKILEEEVLVPKLRKTTI